MKAQIKCDCGTESTTKTIEALKAFYNPCEDCGKKNEVTLVDAPSKGNK